MEKTHEQDLKERLERPECMTKAFKEQESVWEMAQATALEGGGACSPGSRVKSRQDTGYHLYKTAVWRQGSGNPSSAFILHCISL